MERQGARGINVSEQKTVGAGDFIVWLLLSVVTLGIYTSWWTYSRIETLYRAAAKD